MLLKYLVTLSFIVYSETMINLFRNFLFRKLITLLFLAINIYASLTMGAMVDATSLPAGMSFAELQFYQMPDGSFPVFCDTENKKSENGMHECEGCSCHIIGILNAESGHALSGYSAKRRLLLEGRAIQTKQKSATARAPPLYI